MTQPTQIDIQAVELIGLLEEITATLRSFTKIPKGLVEVVQRALEGPDVVTSDCDDRPAALTGDFTVSLKPGDGLRDLLLALRARQVNGELV